MVRISRHVSSTDVDSDTGKVVRAPRTAALKNNAFRINEVRHLQKDAPASWGETREKYIIHGIGMANLLTGSRKIQAVLLDITGVLYDSGGDGKAIQGSLEAISRLVHIPRAPA